MTTRSWTPIDGDPRWENEGYYDEVRSRCDGLALWWSQLHDSGEQRQWARERDLEDGWRYDGDDAPMRRDFDRGPEGDREYEAELLTWQKQWAEFDAQRKARDEMDRLQAAFIEEQLGLLGARMMRPYEHWNEDEAYMAYMERDR